MKDPHHPCWKVLEVAVYMTALTVILWKNASDFDETELQTIMYFLFAVTGGKALLHKLSG